MQLNYLMWQDITVTHLNSKKVDTIPCGTLTVTEDSLDGIGSLSIRGFSDPQGTNTGNNWLLTKPKIISLNPWGVEMEATYWSTTLTHDSVKNNRSHRVRVTAKF